MSSYIVEDRTINAILSHLSKAVGRTRSAVDYSLSDAGYELSHAEDLPRLGHDMFALNVSATSQRYRGESIETLPGTVGHYDYTFGYERTDAAGALEELTRWIYQCSEGDAPEQPLYRLMDHDIRIALMQEIIDQQRQDAA